MITGDWLVIIDKASFVQHNWNLIDRDLLDYYHIMHLYPLYGNKDVM